MNVLLYLQTVVYCLVREAPGLRAVDRVLYSLQKFGIAEFDKELEPRIIPIRGAVWQHSSLSCTVYYEGHTQYAESHSGMGVFFMLIGCALHFVSADTHTQYNERWSKFELSRSWDSSVSIMTTL